MPFAVTAATIIYEWQLYTALLNRCAIPKIKPHFGLFRVYDFLFCCIIYMYVDDRSLSIHMLCDTERKSTPKECKNIWHHRAEDGTRHAFCLFSIKYFKLYLFHCGCCVYLLLLHIFPFYKVFFYRICARQANSNLSDTRLVYICFWTLFVYSLFNGLTSYHTHLRRWPRGFYYA